MRSFLTRALTASALTIGMAAVGASAAAAATYTVQPGDTLASIARSIDEVPSWQALAEANSDRISDPNLIRVGQVLTVPAAAEPAGPDTHTVQPGETLSRIADLYEGVSSWQELARLNADTVRDPNVIRVGQVLALHAGAEGAAAPSTSASTGSSSSATSSSSASSSAPASATSVPVSTWDRLAQCESSGNWSINTGNGYYGGLQFSRSSWEWVGGTGLPHQASKAEQIARAEILLSRQGWGAWPACSSRLGLR